MNGAGPGEGTQTVLRRPAFANRSTPEPAKRKAPIPQSGCIVAVADLDRCASGLAHPRDERLVKNGVALAKRRNYTRKPADRDKRNLRSH